jgi:hypothetical protein
MRTEQCRTDETEGWWWQQDGWMFAVNGGKTRRKTKQMGQMVWPEMGSEGASEDRETTMRLRARRRRRREEGKLLPIFRRQE